MRKLIRTDGSEVEFATPQTMTMIRNHLDADVLDTVLLKDGRSVMLVDDLSHAKALPVNEKATALYWEKCGGPNSWQIRGDVVVTMDSDFGGRV